MKRANGLWRRLASFSNLVAAAHKAARGKRLQDNVAKFLFDFESQILRLEQELNDGRYQPGDDTAWLADVRDRCREFLASLRLKLHPQKSVISRVEDGTRFLGFRVFPTHRLVTKENAKRMRRRLVAMREDFAAGRITPEKVRQRIQSWIGHVGHADSFRLREALLDGAPFVRRAPRKTT